MVKACSELPCCLISVPAGRLLEMLDLEDRIDMECTLIDICLEDDTEIPKQRLVKIFMLDTCCFPYICQPCDPRGTQFDVMA